MIIRSSTTDEVSRDFPVSIEGRVQSTLSRQARDRKVVIAAIECKACHHGFPRCRIQFHVACFIALTICEFDRLFPVGVVGVVERSIRIEPCYGKIQLPGVVRISCSKNLSIALYRNTVSSICQIKKVCQGKASIAECLIDVSGRRQFENRKIEVVSIEPLPREENAAAGNDLDIIGTDQQTRGKFSTDPKSRIQLTGRCVTRHPRNSGVVISSNQSLSITERSNCCHDVIAAA